MEINEDQATKRNASLKASSTIKTLFKDKEAPPVEKATTHNQKTDSNMVFIHYF